MILLMTSGVLLLWRPNLLSPMGHRAVRNYRHAYTIWGFVAMQGGFNNRMEYEAAPSPGHDIPSVQPNRRVN